MKKALLLLVTISLLLLLSNCATISKTSPAFKDSNAYFLQKNIKSMDISPLTNQIDKNESVSIVSLENEETYDKSLIALIEDVLIKKFLDKGYKILERDKDMLPRLIAESGDKFIYGLSKPDYLPLVKESTENANDINPRIIDFRNCLKNNIFR